MIVCAAMLMRNGLIVPGVRHYSPDMRALLVQMYGDGKYHLKVAEQGFITRDSKFVSREEAWDIAQVNGQIRRECGVSGTLFSENLY